MLMLHVRLRFRLRAMHHSLCNSPQNHCLYLSTLSKPVRSECSECSKQECFGRILSTKMGRMWNSPHWIRLQRNSGAVKPKWRTKADRLEKGEWASNPHSWERRSMGLWTWIKQSSHEVLQSFVLHGWSNTFCVQEEPKKSEPTNATTYARYAAGGMVELTGAAMCFHDIIKISKSKTLWIQLDWS